MHPHGLIYKRLSRKELQDRPCHLQQRCKFQSKWMEFHLVGLMNSLPPQMIPDEFIKMAGLINQTNPEDPSEKMVWTYNGPHDITDIINSFGSVCEVYCGMYYTLLVLDSVESSSKLSKKVKQKGGEAEGKKDRKEGLASTTGLKRDSLDSSSSSSDSSDSSDSSRSSSSSDEEHSPGSKRTANRHLVRTFSNRDVDVSIPLKPDLYRTASRNSVLNRISSGRAEHDLPPIPRQNSQESILRRSRSTTSVRQSQRSKGPLTGLRSEPKTVVLLTNRSDIFGTKRTFKNIDAVSAGMFHFVLRQGGKIWAFGVNRNGECGVPHKSRRSKKETGTRMESRDFDPKYVVNRKSEIKVRFMEDLGFHEFPNPCSMKGYMKRLRSSRASSQRSSARSSARNSAPNSARTSISYSRRSSAQSLLDAPDISAWQPPTDPVSPRSPLTQFQKRDSTTSLTSFSNPKLAAHSGSTYFIPEVSFEVAGAEEDEGELFGEDDEFYGEDDDWQNVTIANSKKRPSSILHPHERTELLKSKTQPAHVNIDKNLSHMNQISDLLPLYIQRLSSYSLEQKIEGTTAARKILARNENHAVAVSKFVEGTGIESSVRYLDHPEETLVIEIIWILIRVATTENQEYADRIMDDMNIQKLIHILNHSENDTLLELTIQLLGNLCATESKVVDQRSILPHIMQVMSYAPPPELRRMCMWAVTNIIRCLQYADAKLALPTFSYILEDNEIEDEAVLREACRGMFYLSWNQCTEEIQSKFFDDVEDYVVQCMIGLILSPDPQIMQDCLKTIGNIIASPLNIHTKKCLNGNLAPVLGELLERLLNGEDEIYPGEMIDICWIVSNLCCSTSTDIDLLLEHNLLRQIKMLSFETEDEAVQLEIAFALANIMSCSRSHQQKELEDFEILEHLQPFLKSTNESLVLLIMDIIFDKIETGAPVDDGLVESVREVSERHVSQTVYHRGQSIVNTHTKMKKFRGNGAAARRLIPLPPRPLPIHIPEVYCTFSATFYVFGRGQQIWASGRAICAGVNSRDPEECLLSPVLVDVSMLDSPVKQICGGLEHTLLLTEMGSIYVAGSNKNGCCGNSRWGEVFPKFTRLLMPDPNMIVVQIAAGAMHSVFLSAFNTVFVCGKGSKGALGLGHFLDQRNITQLKGFTEVKGVFAGAYTTGIVLLSEAIHSCGSNEWGTLGIKPEFEGELSLYNASTYARMRKMDLPAINQNAYLVDHRLSVGSFHLVSIREYEYTFEDRLLMSKQEDLFTDLTVSLRREDFNTTTLELKGQQFEIENHRFARFMSKDVSLHYRLKFLCDLLEMDFMTGCPPPETEAEEAYRTPLPGLSYWNRESVHAVCNWILEHFSEQQFKFENVRKELGEAASSWRRRHELGLNISEDKSG